MTWKTFLVVVCIECDDKFDFDLTQVQRHCQLIPWMMIWCVFLLKHAFVRETVTGHLLENPVNSSMKCTEATLFGKSAVLQRGGGGYNIGHWADERGKKTCPPPSSFPVFLSVFFSWYPQHLSLGFTYMKGLKIHLARQTLCYFIKPHAPSTAPY